MDKTRISGDNFYKRVGSSRGKDIIGTSSSNFYIPSNKSETYSTLIQMLKSDLLTIQEMINSNSSDIKMYKLLSKTPGLTKKLSEIEETKNINSFIDKVTEQSANIEKILKIYGTKNVNECIQKLYLECGLNDLLIKKIYDFFTLMKLKINNDDTYQESLSKVIVIKDFIEKINVKNVNTNNSVNIKNLPSINKNNEIEEFLKINTLNELLEFNIKNKKIIPHVIKLVNDYFKNLNVNINKTINQFDNDKKFANEIKNLKGSQVDQYFKLKEIYDKILTNLSDNYNILLKKNDKSINLNDEINKINEKYEKEIRELKNKFEKEKENLTKLNSDKKDTNTNNTEIEKIKQNFFDEKKNLEEKYQKQIENLNNNIKELEKKIKDLEIENSNKQTIETNKQIEIEKIDMKGFLKKHEEEYNKNQKESIKKIDKEIRELTLKVNELKEEVNILKLDNDDMKKKLEITQNKNFDHDSYEQVLLQQFETMKTAFTKKVEELTQQLNSIQFDARKRVYQLEEDLKEANHVKSLFLDQILVLQKQLKV